MTVSQIDHDELVGATMNITNPTGIPTLEAYYPPGYPAGIISSQPDASHERPHPLRAFSLDSTSSYSDMEDKHTALTTQERSQRSRRRPPPGVQQVKHRRTRSGCYTCRQRRIKCDENRPTCERCRKGKRECNYPGGPTTASKTSPKSQSKSSSNEDDSEQSEPDLDDLTGDLAGGTEISNSAIAVESIKTPSVITTDVSRDRSPISDSTVTSPTTTTASIPSTYSNKPLHEYRQDSHQSVRSVVGHDARWFALPADVRLLLTYHRDSLTHHHYSFRHDRNDFLKTTFLEFAINDESEALLYAVVAFASYHYMLACGEAAISNFLSYYNKSIVLLSNGLSCRQPDISTLLTILQLATIEEFLGDWPNMLGHQKAAHQIITERFTPQSLVLDPKCVQIVQWYMRFDIFHALISGAEASLGRDYFAAVREFYRQRVEGGMYDVSAKVDELCSTLQLLAADMSAFMSAAPVSYNAARPTREELAVQFARYSEELETTFSALSESERATAEPSFASDSMDRPLGPMLAHRREILCMNYLTLDFHAVDLMMKQFVQKQVTNELSATTFKLIAMLDNIERRIDDPPSAILNCRGSLATASYFLPREAKYINWARRKFAMIERLGCICPASFRQRLLELWGVDTDEMWLPSDKCMSPILESVREFIQYRTST